MTRAIEGLYLTGGGLARTTGYAIVTRQPAPAKGATIEYDGGARLEFNTPTECRSHIRRQAWRKLSDDPSFPASTSARGAA